MRDSDSERVPETGDLLDLQILTIPSEPLDEAAPQEHAEDEHRLYVWEQRETKSHSDESFISPPLSSGGGGARPAAGG